MNSLNSEDAVVCFEQAPNLNAAVKKIIRSDSTKDPKTARYAKALKAAVKSHGKDSVRNFVERAFPDYSEHLFATLRNAYSSEIEIILDSVIEKYAEDFNETYEIDASAGTINVTEDDKFLSLGTAAQEMIEANLKESSLPANGFMKHVITYSLFDQAVFAELQVRAA